MAEDDIASRTLYVGNLDTNVTEELLFILFGNLGECRSCKMVREPGAENYAFIEFGSRKDAQIALGAMNKRIVLDKEMKVNWATTPGGVVKQDTSKHFHVFVGDLTPDIETKQLREAFAPFGEISDAKIIMDAHTGRSKGFGFVAYVHKEEAELAMTSMNGTWLGGKTIRTNWASAKGAMGAAMTPIKQSGTGYYKELNYNEVYKQTGPNNTTIYCGGIMTGLDELVMRQAFAPYGTVLDIRVFKDKGYAFVRMDTKDAAVRGICGVHGTEISGHIVKCAWGKEMSELIQQQQQQLRLQQSGGLGLGSTPNNVTNQVQGDMGSVPYWGYPGGIYPQYPPVGQFPSQYLQQNSQYPQNYNQPLNNTQQWNQ